MNLHFLMAGLGTQLELMCINILSLCRATSRLQPPGYRNLDLKWYARDTYRGIDNEKFW